MKTRIHVNRHRVAANRKHGSRDPVFSVVTYQGTRFGNEVVVLGPCRLVYRPEKPLACGATVWLECDGEVEVLEE